MLGSPTHPPVADLARAAGVRLLGQGGFAVAGVEARGAGDFLWLCREDPDDYFSNEGDVAAELERLQERVFLATPALLEAWSRYVGALPDSVRASVRNDILGRARDVAEAAGGFLGLGSKVSDDEERVLAELERAFG